MLRIEKLHDYLWVTGPTEDWTFRPEADLLAYGVVGPGHVFTLDRDGQLVVYSAARPSASLRIEGRDRLTWLASGDGRTLYVVHAATGAEPRLTGVDVATGRIVAVHEGLPVRVIGAPVERPDGTLLLETLGTDTSGLLRIDPATGEREVSSIPRFAGLPGFAARSPSGRYWICFDATRLPARVPTLWERLRGTKPRQYGLTLQIWEAFPLRLVRRVVVAWLTVKELPNETHEANRDEVWEAISTAMGNGGPSDPPPTFDAASRRDNLRELARRWVTVMGWQPDETAFWVRTNGFLSCVGVDGTVSPRLYTERLGLATGTWLPCAVHPSRLVALPGREARVRYAAGEARFVGAPGEAHQTRKIPATADDWRPVDPDAAAGIWRRIAALEAERKRIVVPLAGWTEADCIAAIGALADQLDDRLRFRAVERRIELVFAGPGDALGEAGFFARAGTPAAAPAIARLVTRYLDLNDGHPFLYGEDGVGLLGHAVEALGVLDRAFLPVLERYGYTVDAGHEYHFAGTTVPAVIQAHGWTPEVVDFVFWVLVRNFYNTLQDYGAVWRDWGLRDAVVREDPHALARRLATRLEDVIHRAGDPGRYGSWALEKLAEEIPSEPWTEQFFSELDRLFPEGRT